LCNDTSAADTSLGTEIDNPVGAFYDVEIVFDDDDAVPGGDQGIKAVEQLPDIVEM